MNTQIKQALENLFEKHRIVFWYDDKQEFEKDFEELAFDDVTKLEIRNNEFRLKHQMLDIESEGAKYFYSMLFSTCGRRPSR